MLRARTLIVTVFALALVAAACSSSKGHSATGSDSTDGSLSSSQKSDLALARSAVLRPGDLRDYRASTHTRASEIPAALRQKFAQCMNTSATVFDDAPGAQAADSPDFSKGTSNERQVTNHVEVAAKSGDVDQLWNAFSSDQAQSCLEQLDRSLFSSERGKAQGLTYGKPQISQFDVGVGDRSVGYSMVMPATQQGRMVPLDIDVVYVVRDRAGIELNFFNLGPNPDRDQEKQLAQKVYDRIGDKAA